MSAQPIIRNAEPADLGVLGDFLNRNLVIHKHLDWRKPLDWIGHSPFLLLEKNERIQGLLICPSDIRDVYWIRVFAVLYTIPTEDAFRLLFSEALKEIQTISIKPQVASIAYQQWMKELLEDCGWEICQEVVQLHWNRRKENKLPEVLKDNLILRKMEVPDIPEVAIIDQICFDKLWQHSEDAIERAYEQSAYSTVVEKEGKLVGYQMSTTMRNHTHIARLAVLPEHRRMKIGYQLVNDVIEKFKRPWTREISVNTQSDNFKSLGLYTKLGFEKTADGFPIYAYRQ